ncbi:MULTISPECIES: SRPBCC domain-containing protein [unclassified Streptomyces]|uniref:SRPBCC domain-containing protein n=1 Tax=unclassified Streptomyces TaxID=2593676 RepID=UPI000A995C92|nr:MULTISPECIES: SRPBCC domain-containing protein [unclassified Streptomyces]
MEHEVFVPVAVQTLRELLADPARVAPCVPGLHQDAEASAAPLSGRLKVRVGGHSITYRGALRVAVRDDGSYAVEGEGDEVRGTGRAGLSLTVRLAPADGGTQLAFSGTVESQGRLAEAPDDTATAAAHRLLDRFAEALADQAEASEAAAEVAEAERTAESAEGEGAAAAGDSEEPEHTGEPEHSADAREPEHAGDRGGAGGTGDAEPPGGREHPGDTAQEEAVRDAAGPAATGRPERAGLPEDVPGGGGPGAAEGLEDLEAAEEAQEAEDLEEAAEPQEAEGLETEEDGADEARGLFDAPVPPSSLDPFAADDFPSDDTGVGEPPAEAAHARRTMIGRSAEEVDHAPPRGRYAPVPGPASVSGASPLRWLAPAALALASAVIVRRALRRRK